MPVDFLQRDGAHILNIDHHHDNTLFGDRQPRRHRRLVHRRDRLAPREAARPAEITREIATALYVGLVTDTGKFMYENTDPDSHRMAAELIEAGRERRRDLPPAV